MPIFLSCLAENGDFSKVIGLALDGTGYGEDGELWGSEILLVDKASYKRLCSSFLPFLAWRGKGP
ncbi:hypothetical protein DMNBHIDG_00208 [Candidatus Methanoperedenaceae archaeon GB37]|nr:hypothetical protein DMNBHIDG_00208 [Candidatus Methanoperedenaceae archaeon GB37]